jgi:hypothetical protein
LGAVLLAWGADVRTGLREHFDHFSIEFQIGQYVLAGIEPLKVDPQFLGDFRLEEAQNI